MKETNGFIDLKARRDDIKSHALRWFDRITGLPKEIMPDVKYRTGVQVTVKQWGTARNQIFFSVYKPSEDAQFFSAEKLVRSHAHGDFASQNSQNPEEGEYAGSITVFINGVYTQVSVSGLIGEAVSYTHLRAHETVLDLVCRLLLEK